MSRESREIEPSARRAHRDAVPTFPNRTARNVVIAYPQLYRALLIHMREVGDLIDIGREDSARESLSMAAAIESELELTSRRHRI